MKKNYAERYLERNGISLTEPTVDDCLPELYTVALVISVQRRVWAKDEADARDQVLRGDLIIPAIDGVGIGFPQEITVVKEVRDATDSRAAT